MLLYNHMEVCIPNETRTCKKCGQEKPLTSFPVRKVRGKPYRRYVCGACKTSGWRSRHKEQEVNNQRKAREKAKQNRLITKCRLLEHLNQFVCQTCGFHNPLALCFHHRDPATKLFAIASGVGRRFSLTRLKLEVEKCDVVCLNCHSLLHRMNNNSPNKTRNRAQKTLLIKEALLSHLSIKSCQHCECDNTCILSFHHLGDKEFNLAYGFQTNRHFDELVVEATKCKVLCLNCHFIEHQLEYLADIDPTCYPAIVLPFLQSRS